MSAVQMEDQISMQPLKQTGMYVCVQRQFSPGINKTLSCKGKSFEFFPN